MFYIVESSKSFYEASLELPPVVQRLGFVVLASHDLGAKDSSRHKEIELDDDCTVFEVGNYRLTEKLLAADMQLALALPWRLTVFTENGATKIGMLRPTTMLSGLSQHIAVPGIAREIEEKLQQIVDEVR